MGKEGIGEGTDTVARTASEEGPATPFPRPAAEDDTDQEKELASLDPHAATTRESKDIIASLAAHEASVATDLRLVPHRPLYDEGPPTRVERLTPSSLVPRVLAAGTAAPQQARLPPVRPWRWKVVMAVALAVGGAAAVGWRLLGREVGQTAAPSGALTPPAPPAPSGALTPALPAPTTEPAPAFPRQPAPLPADPEPVGKVGSTEAPEIAPVAKKPPAPTRPRHRDESAALPSEHPVAPSPGGADPGRMPAPEPSAVPSPLTAASARESAPPPLPVVALPPAEPSPAPAANRATERPPPPPSLPATVVTGNTDRLARICQQVEAAAIQVGGVSPDFARNITVPLQRAVRPNTPVYPAALYRFIVADAAARRDRASVASGLAAAQASGRLRDGH
jgi:hypothetical protein